MSARKPPPHQPFRLPQGGAIDRSAALRFRFDGRELGGYRGDTLASALLANGRHLVGRSIKYHRPRGIVGLGVEEPNAIVQLGRGASTVANARATEVELLDGLTASSVNRWPSLRLDLGAVAGGLGALLPAGFYYKTFMWPASAWPLYEWGIRRVAGWGRAPAQPDPDRYDKRHRHCDVLVVGAGAAGLAAARAAAASGARVILADERPRLGGMLRASAAWIDAAPAAQWVEAVERELAQAPEGRVLRRCTAFGYYDHNFVAMVQRRPDSPHGGSASPRERLWKVRAKQVVLATGAVERPLLFADNDRPGVMLASAVSGYLHEFAVLAGSTAVVATNNDSAYQCAFDLVDAGARVTVVDSRAGSALAEEARSRGVAVHEAAVAEAAHGRVRVRAVRVHGVDSSRAHAHIPCDLVAVSGGWNPCVHLHAQSGGRPRYDPTWQTFVPGPPVQGERSAGACAGTFDLAGCLAAGESAGVEAARLAGFPAHRTLRPSRQAGSGYTSPPAPSSRSPASWTRAKAFIDLQNDTTVSDVVGAVHEGFDAVEHLKRYTALGLGTDQGKLGNVIGVEVLAATLGRCPAEVGTTTFRPPYTPVTFGALAGADVGDLYDPVRTTALHAWHRDRGAVFEPVGQWLRPRYYPRAGEVMADAVDRECRAVRDAVGIMDASTLGKIDVRGRDAAAFLDRVYVNSWRDLALGRCRYGLMLGEDGMVLDDGVTARLGEHHYMMTTTTGGAARVLAWLERWHQTEWPELDVFFTSVTEHWSIVVLAGPASRGVLQALAPGADLSPDAFPYMTSQDHTVAGVTGRVARVSFSGELAYEMSVPADTARHVWEAAVEAGERHRIVPYGTEAMHVLRAEKGYVIVGQDTDGSVTPIDLGLGRMCARSKDFIGKRSLSRADFRRPDRKQLVGLRTMDPAHVIPEGSQLVGQRFTRLPAAMEGHVTSSYPSARLGHSIALALLAGGRARHGQIVYASLPDGGQVPARVTDPVFYDPTGSRRDG